MAKYFEKVTPESCGVSSEDLIKMIEGMQEVPEKRETHGFMLIRHGKLLTEGWFTPYEEDSAHTIFSCSKTFTQLAIGFMEQEGLVTIDDLVYKYFPDKEVIEYNKTLKIKDLLRMGTGHEGNNPELGKILGCGDDKVQQFFLSPQVNNPPIFRYENNTSIVLSHLVSRLTGKDVIEYLTPRFIEPLGIDVVSYTKESEGIFTGYTGIRLKLEDVAKVGQFFLNGGVWDGKRLISEEWCKQATAKQIDAAVPSPGDWAQGYCWQMWRGNYNTSRICGANGQGCVIAPDQDLVFAYFTGTDGDMLQPMIDNFYNNVFHKLSDEPLAENPEGNAKLEAKIKTLELYDEFKPVSERVRELDGKTFSFEKALSYDGVKLDFDGDVCKVTLSGDKTFSFEAGLKETKTTNVDNGDFVGVDVVDYSVFMASARFDEDDKLVITARIFETVTILKIEIDKENNAKIYTLRGRIG